MVEAIPPVTVGMPVYNGERYVAEAIESILGQTYSDFEFVISDNCSTDGTEEICRSYAARDKRIVYSRTDKNRGAAHNYNRVFQLSRSPLFKFAPHDDLSASKLLEVCIAALEQASKKTVLCFPATIEIDADGTPRRKLEDNLSLCQAEPHERFRAFLRGYHLSNCLLGVLRASAYSTTRLIGPYDSSDVVLLGELALRGQFLQLDEPLLMRRFHGAMSREANRDKAELARWFDPSTRRRRSFRRLRMFREFMRAVDMTPMSTAERMRCRRELVYAWLPRYWKSMVLEIANGVGPTSHRRT